MAEVVHSQGLTVLEWFGGAHGMQAAEQLAKAVELVEVARLRSVAAAAGEQGETEALMFEQGAAVVLHRRNHRHFAVGEFGGEAVLFEDRRIAPAAWAVELGDQRLRVFDAHLIDAVLVAVQRQHPCIAEKADAFHGVQDQVGGKGVEGVGHGDSGG
ncbi:hypothetical protein D3C76_1188650 [compost metagenome]